MYTFLPTDTDTDNDIPKLNENEREYCEGKCGLWNYDKMHSYATQSSTSQNYERASVWVYEGKIYSW